MMVKGNPVELDRLFEQALNAGDIDALVALYEPQAALMPSPATSSSAPRRYAKRWQDSSLPSRRSRLREARRADRRHRIAGQQVDAFAHRARRQADDDERECG